MNNPINKLIKKEDVEKIINYFGNIGDNNTFLQINNLKLYQTAFTHESFIQSIQNRMKQKELNNYNLDSEIIYINSLELESLQSNEILEYHGDHIIKAVMSTYLVDRFPNQREGFLTPLKTSIEKCTALHKIALILGFKEYLLLALEVENKTLLDINSGRNTPSFYEDAFESFIGAIVNDFKKYDPVIDYYDYSDGYRFATRFLYKCIENIIDFSEIIVFNDNYKGMLQSFFNSQISKQPEYHLLNTEGPKLHQIFTVCLTINKYDLESSNTTLKNIIISNSIKLLNYYRTVNVNIFEKLYNLNCNEKYIISISHDSHKKSAEQKCAQNTLQLFNVTEKDIRLIKKQNDKSKTYRESLQF